MIVVAGRAVMKVFAIQTNGFKMVTDLRSKSRRLNMYFSGSVAWSPTKENIIASTSSNGGVHLFDLNYPAGSTDQQYRVHKNAATKVCFHEYNENLLISGSTDATVWLYDLRCTEPSVCFSNATFDSIRDVQFGLGPKIEDVFVAAHDSGTVRFWDLRKPDRVIKEFIAHTGQVSSVALNPESLNLIVTAGRDKFIRIWDWSKQNSKYLYNVETTAPVARVKWCTSNSWHVASCSSVQDNNVHIWDIRRPYLPYALSDAHRGICTDISFPRDASNKTFISCGKDGRLILHKLDHTHRPIMYANSVSVDYASPYNGALVAVPRDRDRKKSAIDQNKSTADQDAFRRNLPSSLYTVVPKSDLLRTPKTIAYLAQKYKLVGGSLSKLCEHNACVAEDVQQDQLAFAWRIISLISSHSELGPSRTHITPKSTLAAILPSVPTTTGKSRILSSRQAKKKESSTAPLVSGSLTQVVQDTMAANSDYFFGSDELNLDAIFEEPLTAASSIGNSEMSSDIGDLQDEVIDTRRYRMDKEHASSDLFDLTDIHGYSHTDTTTQSESDAGIDLSHDSRTSDLPVLVQ